jgi:hypothetical protein
MKNPIKRHLHMIDEISHPAFVGVRNPFNQALHIINEVSHP